MTKFEQTAKGCGEATAYLKRVGKWDAFHRERSTDGYSLVEFANTVKEAVGESLSELLLEFRKEVQAYFLELHRKGNWMGHYQALCELDSQISDLMKGETDEPTRSG